MSWDQWEHKYSCPCGKGTYTQIIRENDWFQSDESWNMDCLICREKYELYSSYNHHNEKSNVWVLKDNLKNSFSEKELIESQIIQEKSELTLQSLRYLPIFLSKFKGIKSKKDLRKKLVEYKLLVNISDSYFYKLSAGLSIDEYLSKAYFDYEHLSTTLSFLNIRDDTIHEGFKEVQNSIHKIEKLLFGIRRNGFVGKRIS